MKLWLISQTENKEWDTYDRAVVCALDEDAARKICPAGDYWDSRTWCSSPDLVAVKEIGLAHPSVPEGVVLASFKAG